MENSSVIDPRLLVEAISKAMLSHDGSVDNHERYQELAHYLRENAYEIAMNVIYSQPPPDAPQDDMPDQTLYPVIDPSYYSGNASPDGLPYYGVPRAGGSDLHTSPDGMSYEDLAYAPGPSHFNSNTSPDGMSYHNTASTDESTVQRVPVPVSQPPVWVKQASYVDIDALLGHASSLADSDYQQLASSPYNDLWMSVYGIDPQVLDSFVSKIKFDHMVRHGALLIGDHLFAERSYETSQGRITVEKVATIVTDVPKGQQGPDIVITCTSPTGGPQTMQIQNCSGPASILQAFNALQPPDHYSYQGCWQNLKVRRADLMLGTLYNVRQAFGYYQMVMDRYALESGTRYRETRNKKKSVDV